MRSRSPHIAFILVALIGVILIAARHYSTGPRTDAPVSAALPTLDSGVEPSIAGKDAAHADNAAPSNGVIVSGKVEVIDADTLRLGDERIRLFGIDAIEADQRCSTDTGLWDCGTAATEALVMRLAGRKVVCEGNSRDRYQRLLAKCRVDNDDVGDWLVSNGWAFAFRRYSEDYVPAEQRARASGAGLWKSQFVFPWEWRKSKK